MVSGNQGVGKWCFFALFRGVSRRVINNFAGCFLAAEEFGTDRRIFVFVLSRFFPLGCKQRNLKYYILM